MTGMQACNSLHPFRFDFAEWHGDSGPARNYRTVEYIHERRKGHPSATPTPTSETHLPCPPS